MWLKKREQESSAGLALRRIQIIVAMDRQKQDGRVRVAKMTQRGSKFLLMEPITVLPDEAVCVDYERIDGVLHGTAFVVRHVA